MKTLDLGPDYFKVPNILKRPFAVTKVGAIVKSSAVVFLHPALFHF